jgi:TonB family protein
MKSRLDDLIATGDAQLLSRSYDAAIDTFRTALAEPGAAEAGVARRLEAACRVRDAARGAGLPAQAGGQEQSPAAETPPAAAQGTGLPANSLRQEAAPVAETLRDAARAAGLSADSLRQEAAPVAEALRDAARAAGLPAKGGGRQVAPAADALPEENPAEVRGQAPTPTTQALPDAARGAGLSAECGVRRTATDIDSPPPEAPAVPQIEPPAFHLIEDDPFLLEQPRRQPYAEPERLSILDPTPREEEPDQTRFARILLAAGIALLVCGAMFLASTQRSRPDRFSAVHGVTAPVLQFKTEPEYTEEARQARIQGTVVLDVEVEPDGTATVLGVVKSLNPGLDQRAIEAVSRWRFRPATRDGQPVKVSADVEVNFRLL